MSILNHRLSGSAIVARAIAMLLVLALGLAACGGDDDRAAITDDVAGEQDQNDRSEGIERAPESADDVHPDPPDAGISDRPGGGGQEDPGPLTRTPEDSQKQAIDRAVRQYLRALHRRDGRRLCAEIFVEGALEQIRLPAGGSGCARRVSESIGMPPEPGGPRWLGARLAEARTVIMVDGGDARMTATMANRLSTTDRTWIEDDVIYLREVGGTPAGERGRPGGEWRIVKPSAVFYRAVGYVEIPIRALTPP